MRKIGHKAVEQTKRVAERESASTKTTGTVDSFQDVNGYGFIRPDGGGKLVFVHFSEIVRDGFKTLRVGEHVEYWTDGSRTQQGDLIAYSVSVIGEASENAGPAPRMNRPINSR
jgi:cold shock protein